MKRKKEPEIISTSYISMLKDLLDSAAADSADTLSGWYEAIPVQMKPLENQVHQYMSKSAGKRVDVLNGLRSLTETFQSPAGHFSRQDLSSSELRKKLGLTHLSGKHTVLPVDFTLFEITKEDSLLTRYRKKTFCRRADFRRRLHKFRSVLRGKDKIKAPRFMRFFNGHSFVMAAFWLPYEKLMLHEWNLYNRAASRYFLSIKQCFDEEIAPDSENKIDDILILENARKEYFSAYDDAKNRIREHAEKLIKQTGETLGTAGTILNPQRKFKQRLSARKNKRFNRELIEDRKAWQEHWQGEVMDFLKDLDLLRLEDHILIAQSVTKQDIEKNLIHKTEKELEKAEKALLGILNHSRGIQELTRKEIRTFIKSNRKTFSDEISERILLKVSDLILSFNLNDYLSDFEKTIQESADNLEEKYFVLSVIDRERLIPQSQVEQVPLREMVITYLKEEIYPEIRTIVQRGKDELTVLSNEPAVLGEIVDSTFDTASIELRKRDNEDEEECVTRTVNEIDEGINRALTALKTLRSQMGSIVTDIQDELSGIEKTTRNYLTGLRKSEKLLALRLELLQSRMRERIRGYWKKFLKVLSMIFRKGFHYLKKTGLALYKPLKQTIASLFRIARLGIIEKKQDSSSVERYLKQAAHSLEDLPAVYRRVFRFDPLDTEKLFVGRNTELESIGEAYEIWRKGGRGMIAVTGERGSGRSTLVQLAHTRYFKDISVHRIVPSSTLYSEKELLAFLSRTLGIETQVKTLNDFERQLSDLDVSRVIIIEDIQRIFLRTIKGLEIFNRFLLFAAKTQESIFWFITCSSYTWDYINKVLGLMRYFSKVVTLEGLKDDGIESMIMRRHRLTGIPIRFLPDPAMEKSKKYRQLSLEEDRQKLLKDQFFHRLRDASTGNISVAMLFWCISINNLENRRFEIGELPDIDVRIDAKISDDELFVIAAIVQHERMTLDEIVSVLSLRRETAHLILAGMANKGILVERDEYYELHFFLYRSMIGYLHEKRLLY